MLAMIPASAVLCLLLAQTLPAAPAPPSEHPTASQTAQAYYQFMLGRPLRVGRRARPGDGRVPGGGTPRSRVGGDPCRARRLLRPPGPRRRRLARGARRPGARSGEPRGEPHPRQHPRVARRARRRAATRATGHAAKRRCISSADAAATAPTPIPSLDLLLARLYVRARQHDKAITLLQDLLERELIPEAYLLLAEAWNGAGNAAEAARALEAGAEASPRLLVSLAEMYEGQQRWTRRRRPRTSARPRSRRSRRR